MIILTNTHSAQQNLHFVNEPLSSQYPNGLYPFDVQSTEPSCFPSDPQDGGSSSHQGFPSLHNDDTSDLGLFSGHISRANANNSVLGQSSDVQNFKHELPDIFPNHINDTVYQNSYYGSSTNSSYDSMRFDGNIGNFQSNIPSNNLLGVFRPVQTNDMRFEYPSNAMTAENLTAVYGYNGADDDGHVRHSCTVTGCSKTFRRRHDLKRHQLLHNPNAKEHACGCCEGSEGNPPSWKRFDKLLKHKADTHRDGKGVTLQTCPIQNCEATPANSMLYFCSQDSLQSHMRRVHGFTADLEVDQLPNLSSPQPTGSPHTQTASTQACNGDPANNPHSIGTKRGLELPSEATSKKIKDKAVTPISKSSPGPRAPDFCRRATNIIDNYSLGLKLERQADWIEDEIQNVYPSEFFKFGNLFYKIDQHLKHSSRNDHQKPSMIFNISSRLIKLRGAAHLVSNLKAILEGIVGSGRAFTSTVRESERRVRQWEDVEDLSNDGIMPKGSQTFPLRVEEDSVLLSIWCEKAIPMLPHLLKDAVGNNYSASLMRAGDSEHTLQAVIQIRVPRLPSVRVQLELRGRVLSLFPTELASRKINVEFFQGYLHLLAGGEQQEPLNTTEDDYPWFRKYWRNPGMGASIGLECSRKISATLGCYIDVDNVTHALTVRHLIEQSRAYTTNNSSDTSMAVSPALSEVDDMTQNFELTKRDLEKQISILRQNSDGEDDAEASTLRSPSGEIQDIMDMIEQLQDELVSLAPSQEKFRLGIIRYQSDMDEDASSRDDGSIGDYLDWTLVEVFPLPAGENRHRFHYDEERREADFISGDVNWFDAGLAFQTIGSFKPEDLVYFVGQTSGFQFGRVNPAPTIISINGMQYRLWQIVPILEQQNNRRGWAGDSGAVVIRCRDRTIVGLLWAREKHRPLLYITPMQAIIDDIKLKAGTDGVKLTPTCEDPPPSTLITHEGAQVEIICRERKANDVPKGYRIASIPTKRHKRVSRIVAPDLGQDYTAIALTRGQTSLDTNSLRIFPSSLLTDSGAVTTERRSSWSKERSPEASSLFFNEHKENKADLTYIVDDLIQSTRTGALSAPRLPLLPRTPNTWPIPRPASLDERNKQTLVPLPAAA